MASLIASRNTFTSQLTRPSAPLSTLRMPHVFVIPPEEEQQDNPPFCCFDADEQPENSSDFASNPDIHFIDGPYLFQHSENDMPTRIMRGTHASVHQPRLRASISKKLEKKQRPEAVTIIETKSTRVGQGDAREDSDVVEVVKVKRVRETLADLEENTKAKRSKTLKVRASEALRSIKNVGKTSNRIHVKDLWTSTESMSGTFKRMEDRPPSPIPKKGSLSRSSSRSLAQIFQAMKSSRLESEFGVHAPSPVASTGTYHTLLAASPPSLPHFRYNHANSSFNEASSTLTTNGAHMSQIPPTKKTLTTKFSVRELHRLLSFSASSPVDSSPLHITTAVPFSSASSGTKPSTSASPHDCSDVPMEDELFADAHFVELDSPDRRLASRYHPSQAFYTRHQDGLSNQRRLSDFSFEMKLDSLHFDALSFDVKDFDVSREGSVLR